jgi:outer membrane lipase/esterase
VLAASTALAGPAAAQSFNQFFGFGDSTIDSGYYRILASPGGGATFNSYWASAVAHGAGKPTSSPGLMSSELLASYFGLSALPADVAGGTNYATSGAKNVDVNTGINGGFTAAVPTVTQIGNYLAGNGGRADPFGLYLISSGGNDVSFATGNSGTGPYPLDPAAYLVGAAGSLADAVARLQAAGAQYFIVRGLPFDFPLGGGAGNAATRADRLLYTQALWADLAARGVNFIPSDYNAVRLAIQASPSSFGFLYIDNTVNYACTKPAGVTTAWALLCSADPNSPSTFVTPDADRTRLFADDQHLTTAGQKIVADYEYSLVVAPSMISMLAEAPVVTRTALVNSIQNQIPISQRQQGPTGFNSWLSGDVSSLKIENYPGFPDDPGTPVALTAGFDYKFPGNWLVGATVSGGRQTASFGLGFGGFTQNEVSGSVYVAHIAGPVWFDVIASYGSVHYDVGRNVPVGITVQNNSAATSGTDLSLAGETGYNFLTGAFTHGPIVGLTLQQVHIGGFTESGSFTSLGFDSQTRNSQIGDLGYQVSFDAGPWRPFAKATWDHEFASKNRTVTAWLTTTTAPSYFMPAVAVGTDWASATAGTTLKMANNVTGLIAFTSTAARQNVTTYGGEVGVNVAF